MWRETLGLKSIIAILISLVVFTSCAREDESRGYRDNRYASPPSRAVPVAVPQPSQYQQPYPPQYQQQYYQPYPAPAPYQPQYAPAQQYNPYGYGVPNSRSYTNPYDFQQPYGGNPPQPNSDNDQDYTLPKDFITS